MPSFVQEYLQSGNFNTTGTPKTVSVTVADGDTLVVMFCSADYRQQPNTPTGGGLTYTLRVSANMNISNLLNNLAIWTAPSSSAQTFTLSIGISPNNGFVWGFLAHRFRGVSRIGNSGTSQDSSNTTAPLLNLTTLGRYSTISMFVSDFGTETGARTYRTAAGAFTETHHTSNTNYGSSEAGYYLQAGDPGSYALGQTAPTPRQWLMGAVELQPGSLALSSNPTSREQGALLLL